MNITNTVDITAVNVAAVIMVTLRKLKRTLKLLLPVLIIVAGTGMALAETVAKTVALEDVQQIILKGSHQLSLRQGEEEFVKVTASRELLKRIVAEIRGDTLYLSTKGIGWSIFSFNESAQFEVQLRDIRALQISGSNEVNVMPLVVEDFKLSTSGSNEVSLVSIEADRVWINASGSTEIDGGNIQANKIKLSQSGSAQSQFAQLHSSNLIDIKLSGSAEMEIDQLNAEELEVDMSGACELDITGTGQVLQQEIDISGAGEYQAKKLSSQFAYIDISGAAGLAVKVSDKLTVDVRGSASVLYIGDPEVISDVSGAAEINQQTSH